MTRAFRERTAKATELSSASSHETLQTVDQSKEDSALVAAIRYRDAFPADLAAIYAFMAVAEAGNELAHAGKRLLATFGPDVKPARFSLLRALYLAEDKRLPLKRLAKETSVAPPNITYQLDVLERAGLVTKVTSETDARVTYAQLTLKGDDLCRVLIPAMVHFMSEVSASLTEAEKDVLAKLLTRFRQGIRAVVSDLQSARD